MATNLDKYRADLKGLIDLGDGMLHAIVLDSKKQDKTLTTEESVLTEELENLFFREYQGWYTEASAVIRQLIPDRLTEFEHYYKGDGKRKSIVVETYNIQDWINGVRVSTFNNFASVAMRFQNQLQILKASERRFESSLFNMCQLVSADLLDSEVETARELLKHGFNRAAGAIAGVVLEKHLGQIAENHKLSVKKKDPTVSDLNDLFKSENIFEIPIWRQVQRLGDLRNLCVHNKLKEPTSDEVEELIAGVQKVTKTLF